VPDRARLRRQRTLQGRRFLPGEAAVRDTLLRLGLAAAAARRRQLTGTTFIGVTGSAGKTTTKELIAAMLGNGTTSTQGNQNRISRVGLAIMRTRPGTGICVAEVAAWRPGSVNQIARLLQPRIGVVTRIGTGVTHVNPGDEVFGIGKPRAAMIGTTSSVVRFPGRPPTQCLSATTG